MIRSRMFAMFFSALLQPLVLFAQPINAHTSLDVGGNELYFEVSGPNREAPLLLFLHGGPGSVAHLLMFQATVGQQLERDFLVVYLHQRGVGKSSDVPDSEQTLSAHVADVKAVVDYLKKEYDQDKIILVGHSWGGMLAGLFAAEHSADLEKLVLISTAMNMKSLLSDDYEVVLNWAKEEGVSEAIEQLAKLEPSFDTPQHYMTILDWAGRAGPIEQHLAAFNALMSRLDVEAEYPDWNERQNRINFAMIPEMMTIDLDDEFSMLKVPALFVSGADDTIITQKTMRRDYDRYGGEKEFIVLEHSHHLPFVDQPDELVRAMREFLLR